jgi:hypothetical protein
VTGSTVYRGTNELSQKTFWKTFSIFQGIWKNLQTIFSDGNNYRFQMMTSIQIDLPLRRSSARLGWWFGWYLGFQWMEIEVGYIWYHHFSEVLYRWCVGGINGYGARISLLIYRPNHHFKDKNANHHML